MKMSLGDTRESRGLRRMVETLQMYRINKLDDTLHEHLENGGKPMCLSYAAFLLLRTGI
ncbi:hypothetical protein KXD93_21920 [Mucilaginibacter sp. BJC16-A38]|uniref:hypothetical protein n=1 Tax=Mucilaginibacter phenanthrenivorans TaxID=1234842 RepID=UPI0021579EEA|nr:hypothetical protein [Mucilaginibacter phenanthrenivorans]MCR8560326.1 hypothetical protein [Mucilaginibacter phenanthrenivorans]